MTTNYFANSRMYNIGPDVTAAWHELFVWVMQQTGIVMPIVHHSFPEPIEELWLRPNMGCVLMCGYPFMRAKERPTLLAAPVPSLPHYAGKSIYYSHLLVGEDSEYETIEDTFGGRISWTIENSQSGFNAVRSFLLGFRTEDRPFLYKQSIGPLGTFTVGVEGIRRGEIDVVPIDTFSHDLMSRYTPEKLAGTRIIATTPAAPFPPLVAAPEMPAETAQTLRKALYRAHEAPELERIFKTVYLERFDPTDPTYYESMLKQAAVAEAAGYLKPS